VGATEADLRAGRLSAESPMAKALIGSRLGQEVAVQTPRGPRRYRIARLGA
jgi:transcription elongation factor GreA